MMDNLKKLGRSMAFQFSHFRQSLQQGMRIRRDQWYALFRLFTHPIDALNDIKYEGKASLAIADLLAALFFLEQLFAEVATGYLYGVQEADRRSVLISLSPPLGCCFCGVYATGLRVLCLTAKAVLGKFGS